MVHTTHPRKHTWHLNIYPPRYFIIYLFITLIFLLFNMCNRLYTSKIEQSTRHYSVRSLPYFLNCFMHVTTNCCYATADKVRVFFKRPQKINCVLLGTSWLWIWRFCLREDVLSYPFCEENYSDTCAREHAGTTERLHHKTSSLRGCESSFNTWTGAHSPTCHW